ncbi:MAG: response regulator [Rhodoluna sp.]
MSRGLRVLYVENDEALLGLVSQTLKSNAGIQDLTTALNSDSAIKAAEKQKFDVALLDVSLGPNSLTGIELAMNLRDKNEHLGLVFLSQNISDWNPADLDKKFRYGWSAIQKTVNLSFEHLVEVLTATALGQSIFDPNAKTPAAKAEKLSAKLTVRQHQVIALAANGLDATEIAKRLQLASVTVRQELSKCYKVLIPNPKPGTDLRTAAVLRYLRDDRSGLS